MKKEIEIDKTASVIIDGRVKIDIDAVMERFGGIVTKNGVKIPRENIKEDAGFVWLPFKGDRTVADIAIPIKRFYND